MPGIYKNLVGKRFNRLLVIKDTGKRGKDGTVYWECLCDCGTVKRIRTSNLNNSTIKSCGCLNRELAGKRARKNLRGARWVGHQKLSRKEILRRQAKMNKVYVSTARKTINDFYIKNLLVKRTSLKHADIPNELVLLKRTQVKIKRYLKGGL